VGVFIEDAGFGRSLVEQWLAALAADVLSGSTTSWTECKYIGPRRCRRDGLRFSISFT